MIDILPGMPTRGLRTKMGALLGAAALVSLGSLLAGCDGHSKPTVASPLPSTATTPAGNSPSPSGPVASVSSISSGTPTAAPSSIDPSAAASKYPDAAAKIPAAIQTVRDYFDAYNHELDSGDENAISVLFTTDCTKCINDVVSVQRLRDGGHTLRGGHVHVKTIDRAAAIGPHDVAIWVTGTQDAGDQLDSSGKVVQHFPPGSPFALEFELETDRSPPVIWHDSLVDQ